MRADAVARHADPFKGLRNIGPAARADLAVLGIAGKLNALSEAYP